MKGVKHVSVGNILTQAEYEYDAGHDMEAGTSFPGSPTEKDLFYRTDLHKWYVYNGTTWVGLGGAGAANPPWYGILHTNYGDCDPQKSLLLHTMAAVAGPTPTNIGTSVARCVQFTSPANITVNRVKMFGVGATSGLYKLAIYPVGLGSSKIWEATVNSAANTWMVYAGSGPFSLVAETKYWFCVTVTATGTTAGFRSLAAPLGTAFWSADNSVIGGRSFSLPVFAQFAVTGGAFPATLPAIVAAAYAAGTTGSVPFALLDNVI